MGKKIEPTEAMVNKAANALALETTGTALHLQSDAANHTYRSRARVALRVLLNHPDAVGPFAAEADRPWEPLDGPPRVGDEVRQDRPGITITAVVVRVDKDGDPWTAEGALIGMLSHGPWYVRRAVQELPEADGAVIVPADGHEYIETRVGKKSRRLTWDAECLVWYDARGTHLHGDITPGTWKVEGE